MEFTAAAQLALEAAPIGVVMADQNDRCWQQSVTFTEPSGLPAHGSTESAGIPTVRDTRRKYPTSFPTCDRSI